MTTLLPSTLETTPASIVNWNDIHTANMQKINTKLGVLMSSPLVVGAPVVNDAADPSQQTITDSSTGTASTTVSATGDATTNNNFATLLARLAEIKIDLQAVKDKQDEILDVLRSDTGVGLIGV